MAANYENVDEFIMVNSIPSEQDYNVRWAWDAATGVAVEKFTSTNTGSQKLSGAVCRWCYGHKDMCAKCVFGSEFSPAAQHRAGA